MDANKINNQVKEKDHYCKSFKNQFV